MVEENHLKLVIFNGWKSFQQDSLRPPRAENMRGNVKDFNQEQAGNNCWAWDYRVIYSGITADKALRIRANISRKEAHNRRITGKKYSVLSWLETKIVWDPIWIKFTKMIVMWFNLKWLFLLGRGKSWKKKLTKLKNRSRATKCMVPIPDCESVKNESEYRYRNCIYNLKKRLSWETGGTDLESSSSLRFKYSRWISTGWK